MAPRLLIIADDLTGALDAAAPFAAAGMVTRVARRPQALAALDGAEVMALSTASRQGSVTAARASIEALAPWLMRIRPERVFKKVDSRLKGHVSAETAVLARLLGCNRVLACPAVPELGRVVRAGRVEGAGVDRPIDVAAAFSGAAAEVDTPPAATAADLDAILDRAGPDQLLAGARGLSAALARRMGRGGAQPVPPPVGRLMMAIGSRDPVTLAQIEALTGAAVATAPDGHLPTDVADRLRGPLVLLRLTGSGDDPAAGRRFATGTAALVDALAPKVLFACGGETADALLDALDIDSLTLGGEMAPGMPWGRADGRDLAVITKSGGFGAADLLARLAAAVHPPCPAGAGPSGP